MKIETVTLTLPQHEVQRIMPRMIERSCWFEVMPMPYSLYEITVKRELIGFFEKLLVDFELDYYRNLIASTERSYDHNDIDELVNAWREEYK